MSITITKKYRPVLTAGLVDHIMFLAKSESPISQESIELISILAPFQAKIKNAGVAEAYSTTAKPSLEEQLGMPSATVPTVFQLGATTYLSKEEYWAACYHIYLRSPSLLSLEEIQAAREHMYLHDLMSDDEMRLFESHNLNTLIGDEL